MVFGLIFAFWFFKPFPVSSFSTLLDPFPNKGDLFWRAGIALAGWGHDAALAGFKLDSFNQYAFIGEHTGDDRAIFVTIHQLFGGVEQKPGARFLVSATVTTPAFFLKNG